MEKHAGTGLGCKRDGGSLSNIQGKHTKRENPNNWHPKLKETVEKPLKETGFPTFTKILQLCKLDAYNIYPRGSEVCTPNAFFGRCYHGNKCSKLHKLVEDRQITDILKILDPFIKSPKKVNAVL